MNNFWTLTGYEWKKLFKRKIVWISTVLFLVISGFLGVTHAFGEYYVNGEKVDSHFHMLQTDMAYEKELSGRKMDEKLLTEMQNAYAKVPEVPMYTTTEEYQTYARPYSAIRNWAGKMTSLEKVPDIKEEELYESNRREQEKKWKKAGHSERERDFLRTQASDVKQPFVFQYCQGYETLISGIYTIGILEILLLAICIPGIFSEEYIRKTKPVIAGTVLGKGPLYLAKIFVSAAFSLGVTALSCLIFAAATFLLYGADGFHAQIQYLNPRIPWPLTVGKGVLLLMGMLMLAALLISAVSAWMAEKTKSSVVPMAVLMAYVMGIGLINIPEQYHLVAKLWDILPANLTMLGNAFGDWLWPFFGTYLPAWKVAPILYLLGSFFLFWLGRRKSIRPETQ